VGFSHGADFVWVQRIRDLTCALDGSLRSRLWVLVIVVREVFAIMSYSEL